MHQNYYEEEEYGHEDDDAVVDRIFDQTDEKQECSGSIYSEQNTNSINLGPNLNLQVNAIGSVRRRKRAIEQN